MTNHESGERDWAAEATNLVVTTVDTVKAKTTSRIQLLTKALVYGFLIIFLAVAIVLWALILVFRVVDNFMPGEAWSAYLVFGLVFTLGGLFAWRKRGRLIPVT